jgi:hypothetical protein
MGVIDNLRDLVVNGMIIIKYTLNKHDRSTMIRSVFATVSVCRPFTSSFEYPNGISGNVTRGKFL